MKADKSRGVVIMNKSKYLEKCLTLLNSEQFVRLNEDHTKTNESKVQRMLRKIKPNLADQEYKILYPSGSAPGRFYCTVKLHRISINDGVDKLPIHPNYFKYWDTYLLTCKVSGKTFITIGKSRIHCYKH